MDNALVVEVPHPLMQQSTEDGQVLNSEVGRLENIELREGMSED